MKKFNYHTHSRYCDGKGELREYVEKALQNDFEVIGFSSHSNISDNNGFSINSDQIDAYINELRALKEEYADRINILSSFEFEYIPGVSEKMETVAKRHQLDYILGSVHLVIDGPFTSTDDIWLIDGGDTSKYDDGLRRLFGGDAKKAVKAYYRQVNQMLDEEKLDILGHFDKIKMNNKNRFFLETDAWYQALLKECIHLIKEKDVVVEVNTRGLYKGRHPDYYPAAEILKTLKQLNIPLTISTDAHHPDELALLWVETEKLLLELGFRFAGLRDGIFVYC